MKHSHGLFKIKALSAAIAASFGCSAAMGDVLIQDANDVVIAVNADEGAAGNFVVTDGSNAGVGGTTFILGDSEVLTLSSTTVNVTGELVASSISSISTVTITGNSDDISSGEGVVIKSDGGATSASQIQVLDTGYINISASQDVSITGGIDNNSGGISEAGAISGVTTLSASGAITAGSLDTGSGTIATTGTVSAGTVSATTGSITTLNSTTINNSGTTTTGALSVTSNASVGGNLAVTGTTTLNGATTIDDTLNVTGLTTTAGITNTGSLTQVGTTEINNTATANATTIGNSSNTASVSLSSGNGTNTSNITVSSTGNLIAAVGSNTNTITGTTNINTTSGSTTNIATGTAATTNIGVLNGTNVIAGTTSINASVNNATNINTGTSTGAVTIGNSANTTNLNSATNNIGVNAFATTNNIGTGSAVSTNNIGNSQTGTTVTATAGNSVLSVANGTASLRSGAGPTASGFSTFSASQTLSSVSGTLATELNGVGDAASRQNIAGATYVNRLEGNTLINGNTYINGTLVYTSNSSATTTVTSGSSVLAGATQATTGQTNIANQGGSGAVVDENGKITQGIVGQTTGSMVVTNGVGNTHGFVVTETQAVMSGGVNSTSLTLDDRGATFSNSATGAPVTVTGVADGRADFDAVNVRQYAHAIAAVSASAHIPAPQPGKDMSVGVGVGSFMGKTALAFGGNFRVSANAMIKASISSGLNGGSRPVVGVGAGWSW